MKKIDAKQAAALVAEFKAQEKAVAVKASEKPSYPLTVSRHGGKVAISWKPGQLPLLEKVEKVTAAKKDGVTVGQRERYFRVGIVEKGGLFLVALTGRDDTGAGGEYMKVTRNASGRFRAVAACAGEDFDARQAEMVKEVEGGYIVA